MWYLTEGTEYWGFNKMEHDDMRFENESAGINEQKERKEQKRATTWVWK
jgi:hypothetical protein